MTDTKASDLVHREADGTTQTLAFDHDTHPFWQKHGAESLPYRPENAPEDAIAQSDVLLVGKAMICRATAAQL